LGCAGAADELFGLADALVALFPVFDVPHAATANAAAAAAAKIANRVSRAVGEGTGIGVLRSLACFAQACSRD
jgi:predicted TIM-barrel enzyme